MTRETVFFETLASRAMSLMVARRPTMPSMGLEAEADPAPGVPAGEPEDLDLGMVLRSVRGQRGWTK